MFFALAAILLTLSLWSVVVVRSAHRHNGPSACHRHPEPTAEPCTSTSEQVTGFLYVGAGALAALALTVVLIGHLGGRPARAEGLAIFGFFGYTLYLLAALLIQRMTTRR